MIFDLELVNYISVVLLYDAYIFIKNLNNYDINLTIIILSIDNYDY